MTRVTIPSRSSILYLTLKDKKHKQLRDELRAERKLTWRAVFAATGLSFAIALIGWVIVQ